VLTAAGFGAHDHGRNVSSGQPGAPDRSARTSTVVAALLLGLIVQLLLGLVGGGGSILAVPALVYGVGLPLSGGNPEFPDRRGCGLCRCRDPRLCRGVNWRLASDYRLTGGHPPILVRWSATAGPAGAAAAFAVIMIVAGVRMFPGDQVRRWPLRAAGRWYQLAECLPRAPRQALSWASSPGCSAWAGLPHRAGTHSGSGPAHEV
jgi:hypothetical protein